MKKLLQFLFWTVIATTMTCPALLSQVLTGGIRGVVKDIDKGDALVGANVIVLGTTKGTSTNFEGAFSIKDLPAGSYTVVARYVGYVSNQQSVLVASGVTVELNFNLKQDVLNLDEVVITGLSGTIPRSELGNSISKITGSTLQKAVTTNILDAMAAKAPGVQVTKSTGAPGSGTFVTIRGRHTITGSSQPLYVVDGMVIDNSTTGIGPVAYQNRAVDINPNDIESIEIIKGASAAAIYGSRASNGVVLITTKSGSVSQPGKYASINYSTSYTTEAVPKEWPLQTKYGQRIPYKAYTAGSTDSWGPLLAPGTQTYDQSTVLFRKGDIVDNSLTITGGSPFFKYLVSGAWTGQNGTFINSDLSKRNFRANLFYSPLEQVGVTSNSNYITSRTNNVLEHNSVSGIILAALRSPPEFNQSKYLEDDGRTQRRFASYDNPLWSANFNSNSSTLSRFIHSTEVNYDALTNLRLSASLGIDRYDQGFFQRVMNGSATQAGLGAISQARVTNNVINTNLMLTWKDQLTSDVLLSVIGGQQLTFTTRNTTSAGSTNTLPFFGEIPAGATPTSSSSRLETRVFGYFAQASASAWNRLTLTGSLRYDGSSTFGEANRWFLYPKGAVSYRLSEEGFMSDLKGVVDELKLRAAWGIAGIQPGAYSTNYLYLTSGFGDPWGRSTSANRLAQSGLRFSTSAGNSQIRPEKTTEIETGFDLTMFDRILNFEFSYFRQDIKELLLFTPVPGSTGYTSQYRNAGEMEKTGFELKLEVAPISVDDFRWIMSASYAENTDKVTKLEGLDPQTGFIVLSGGFAGISNIAREGYPLGMFFGVGWDRDANKNIIYSDTAGAWNSSGTKLDNVLSPFIKNAPRYAADRVIIGNPNPKWTGTFRSDFTFFNNLSISVLFDIAWKFDVWNGTNGALFNFGTAKQTEDRDALWFNQSGTPVLWMGRNATDTLKLYPTTVAGVTKYARVYAPGDQMHREVYYRTYGNGFNFNEDHIEDGSYVKLRDVSVSYRIAPVPFLNFESAVLTFSARNLKTWTDYSGYDPEVNQFDQSEGRGYDYFNQPQVRSYRFGISISY